MNQRITYGLAAGLGALAVALGAFGAHALKAMLLANDRLDTYHTAVQFHFYHVMAMLFCGLLMDKLPAKPLRLASSFFLTGIILFSGSLYVLCFTGITRFGIVTPFGGVLFIAGWILMLAAAVKK